nr:MAG TPA: protein of unknown function (DUF5361) [Caudoviricetes sp.]
MLREDKDALICDLAETYGIYSLEGLPISTLATLSFGLRENSRIKMKLSGIKATNEETLLAMIVDRLSILCWGKTKDGQKGRNKPKMITDILLNGSKKDEVKSYDTIDSFKTEWDKITQDKGVK